MRYSLAFHGRVQGVYFRATAKEVARRHAVTGWVRNEADGTVRCVVEGEEDELDRFVAALQEAKRGFIERTEIDRGEGTGEFEGFGIR